MVIKLSSAQLSSAQFRMAIKLSGQIVLIKPTWLMAQIVLIEIKRLFHDFNQIASSNQF
jgi:hypothetical protein